MMFPRLALLAAVLGVVSADLQVTSPGTDTWWVAQSINTIAWTCQDSTHQTFTILIGNSDPKVLVQPQAIIAIENNFDCSKTITQDQASQPAGTGYTILLADPLNNTNVFATSQPFEIKPLGSAYPSSSLVASPSATNSGSASGSGSSPTPTAQNSKTGGAMGLKASFSGAIAIAAAALGLTFA